MKKLKKKLEKIKEQFTQTLAELEEFKGIECNRILQSAIKYDLVYEVVQTALEYKGQNSDADMLECLQEAAAEWDIY